MRHNSPLAAALALAALSLSPAPLSAAHPHHSAASARRAPHPHDRSPRPHHAHSAEQSRQRAGHPSAPTLSRTHHPVAPVGHHHRADLRAARLEAEHTHGSRHHHATAPQQDTTSRKATADDFVAAAAGSRNQQSSTTPAPAPVPHSTTSAPAQSNQGATPATSSPARSLLVVNVIRATQDHPQLPTIQQAAAEPIVLPTLYNARGRLIVPRALVGSHEILVRQNEVADKDGLGRVQDDADLDAMRDRRLLVALPSNEGMHVDDRLPTNRRYCRPWTAQFLATLARAHYTRFHTPLQVNSAVRTVEFQQHLLHINGNAAPAEGDTASPHLTGQAIDIAKHGLSLTEIAWLRGYLLPLIQEGRVDVEEEFQQSCFHISVYKRYLPADSQPQRYVASSRGTAALASAMH